MKINIHGRMIQGPDDGDGSGNGGAAPPAEGGATPPAASTPPPAAPTALNPGEGSPPAAPPATPPAAGGSGGEGEPPANPFAALPDDWRSSLLAAGGYEGDDLATRGKQLERVSDMGSLMKTFFSSQDMIRKGHNSTGLPESPTDVQVADWREANDVPATATDYTYDLPEGVIMGDTDKGIVDQIAEIGHGFNVSNAAMNAMVTQFLASRDAEIEAQQSDDGVHAMQTTNQLKAAWGQDYETNINIIQGFTNQLPETIRDDFMSARLADGRAVFNSPEMMVFFADVARKLNPAGAVVPNSTNPVQSINDEVAELEKKDGEPPGVAQGQGVPGPLYGINQRAYAHAGE